VEFADSGSDPDDERGLEVLEHLLRQATAQTYRARCAGLDLTGLQEHFSGGETVESGELVPAPALLGQLGTIPKLAELLGRLGVPEGEQSAEQAAAAVEFALEGLYLTRRLAKDTDGIRTVYGA
jgi:magnesium chelatase subunit I